MMAMHLSGWYSLVDIAVLYLAKKVYNIQIYRCTILCILWFFLYIYYVGIRRRLEQGPGHMPQMHCSL
jgi:hypothetical protein